MGGNSCFVSLQQDTRDHVTGMSIVHGEQYNLLFCPLTRINCVFIIVSYNYHIIIA